MGGASTVGRAVSIENVVSGSDHVTDSSAGSTQTKHKQQRQLTLGTWNVGSLGNKYTSVSEFISDRKLDMFAVTESWHVDSADVAVRRSAPAGYRYVDTPRPGQRGGGVVLFFREHYVVKKVVVPVGQLTFEHVSVSVSTLHGPVCFVVVYRPGSVKPDSAFFQEFSALLETLATFNSQLIITGDLNVHFEDANDRDTIRMNEMLSSFGLVQHVDQPTHNLGGVLDVIITRTDCNITDLRMDPPALSDHGPVSCSIPYACAAAPVFAVRHVRGWKKLDHDAFRLALLSSPLCRDDDYYSGMTVDELFDIYNTTLRDALDSFVPKHEVRSRCCSSPWFDGECRSMKRRVRLLERRYRRSKSQEDRLAWIIAIREKHVAFKNKENAYWEGMVTTNARNPKKLWNSVSTILGNKGKRSANPPPFSAADFHRFMDEKAEVIRSATAGSPPPTFNRASSSISSFGVCSQKSVHDIIAASAAKSCDLDPVPTFLVKDFLSTLLPFLTRICNASIQEGHVPSSQKEAIVTPSLKKHDLDPADIRNYRPISNLPFMSKVVEKLVYQQLSVYLAEHDLFPKLQSGFRRHHSTETAILRVLSDIYSAIDNDQVALLALLDVSAAFDTVDHSILLERLATSYGLSGKVYSWFESFVIGRTQSVHLGGSTTKPASVRSGMAQGSILGPVLYVLYTSDVEEIIESLGLRSHLYADDTQLYGSCPPSRSAELAARVLRVIDSVSAWMASNRLRLNQDKTQFIWFGSKHFLGKRDIAELVNVSPSLVMTTSVRNLGVMLDMELTMVDHVANSCRACFFQLRRLRAIRHSLTPASMLTLVHAFIVCRIDYCNGALYGASSYLLDRLQSVMNAAARLILRIPKYGHISAAIRDRLHWLPVPQRIEFKLALTVRNCLTGAGPVYLSELCIPVSSDPGRRNLRSASHGDLLAPGFRKERSGRRGFSVCGPRIWNALPLNIRNVRDNLASFKKALKTELMRRS